MNDKTLGLLLVLAFAGGAYYLYRSSVSTTTSAQTANGTPSNYDGSTPTQAQSGYIASTMYNGSDVYSGEDSAGDTLSAPDGDFLNNLF